MTKFKNLWSDQLFQAFSIVTLMAVFVFFQETFGVDGFLNAQLLGGSSLIKWLVLWGIKLFLVIVADMFILSVFIQIRSFNGRLRQIFRGWTIWVIVGIVLTVFLSTQGNIVGLPQFLSALFPITRNSFSFLTGVLVFGMVVPYLKISGHEHLWKACLIIILALPMLGQDIWTFGNGFGLSAAVVFGLTTMIPIHRTGSVARHAISATIRHIVSD